MGLGRPIQGYPGDINIFPDPVGHFLRKAAVGLQFDRQGGAGFSLGIRFNLFNQVDFRGRFADGIKANVAAFRPGKKSSMPLLAKSTSMTFLGPLLAEPVRQ